MDSFRGRWWVPERRAEPGSLVASGAKSVPGQRGTCPESSSRVAGWPISGIPLFATVWPALHAGTVRHAWTQAPAAWAVLGTRTSPRHASRASATPLVLHPGLGPGRGATQGGGGAFPRRLAAFTPELPGTPCTRPCPSPSGHSQPKTRSHRSPGEPQEPSALGARS